MAVNDLTDTPHLNERIAELSSGDADVAPLATIEVFRGTDKKYYWHMQSPNGKILCVSQGYTTSSSALKSARNLPNVIAKGVKVLGISNAR